MIFQIQIVYILSFHIYGLSMMLTPIVPQDPSCQIALGMESKKIKDEQLTSPTNGHYKGKDAFKARLNGISAYCTPGIKRVDEAFYESEYMEIDLIDSYKITGFAIQGLDSTGSLYPYGDYMRLWTSSYGGHYRIYKTNGERKIELPNWTGGKTVQFIPLSQVFASKLKIQLLSSSNIYCLRMEIYGCIATEYKEYSDCKSSQTPLISRNQNQMKFTETDAMKQEFRFGAEFLSFSRPNAWCLIAGSKSIPSYKEWAKIDMAKDYLIYGIQVKGYLATHDAKDKMKYIPEYFKFKYSLDGKTEAYAEAKQELLSSKYGTRRNFTVPLIARYIHLSMLVEKNGNLTCIKLEVYGCDAKLHDGTVTTQPAVNPTNTTNPSARIARYHIYQGSSYAQGIVWNDVKYNGKKDAQNELNDGTGCLNDEETTLNDNPFTSPKCWLGWKQNNTKKPYIYVVLTRPIKVVGIHIRTFVNNSMGAKPIKKISVEASTRRPARPIGYLCSPDTFYNQDPKITDYFISLNDMNLQYLNLKFEYAGLWILVRQITFIKPGNVRQPLLPLSSELIDCVVPAQITDADASAGQVTVIVIIVLVMLLLILVAFIIHHYRTNLHKVWKSRSRNSIIVRDAHSSQNDRFITSDPPRGQPYTKVQYTNKANKKYNKINDGDEDIYAAVGEHQNNSFDSGVLSDQQIQYADCEDFRAGSHNNTPNGTMLYSVPDTKQYAVPDVKEYAQPDTVRNEVIYQGSNIYAPKYENPYKATIASSFYAEPGKLSKKTSVKIFPRNQLVFKDKIGVGQFGEVHIAEATGLDEIYGSVGHFNSWGLPDTAMVAVKLLKSTDSEVEKEFMKEVEVMARLKDENVVRLLGVCHEQPKLMVVEYMENGDLNQFLRERKPDLKNCRTSQIGPNVLILDQLLHMAQQISAGMKYLHSVGFIHRDLATRNCLVGPAYQVKIADFGMSRYVYTKHYYRVEGKAVLPIRWMAPECLYYGKFTLETDVWSFGVTLWEIFSFAKDSPYADLNDPQVIEAACDLLQNPNRTFPYLSQPDSCPSDVYEHMKKCWTTYPKHRPDFTCLYQVLSEKCGSSSEVLL